MSKRQKKELREFLEDKADSSTEFHHGDCIGADEEAHMEARDLGFFLVGHPPIDDRYRAHCKFHKTHKPKPYITRNHDIVDDTDMMVAAPRTDEEEIRSGTWATIRYAEEQGKEVKVLKR